MFKIEETKYGYHLIFSDPLTRAEMIEWIYESKTILQNSPKKFGVLVDMRFLSPLSDEARFFMTDGQMIYKKFGMERSAVIVSNNLTLKQFQIIAKKTDIYVWERYYDASIYNDWERRSLDWIIQGIDWE